MDDLEARRGALQAELDGHKTQLERNRLGQFATPTPLARDIVAHGLALLPDHAAVSFLDPAIGTGAFYSALRTLRDRPIRSARGFEIDAHYGQPAQALWQGTRLEITLADFTCQAPPAGAKDKANLLICNPPYVRHHCLDAERKIRLRAAARQSAHVDLSGLSGLYCYFMALAHSWMSDGGIAGWLIPSEFMEVNYGRELKQYLMREVTLLHVHRFDPNAVQFDDALVSSSVVWFRKEKPPAARQVMFSYGGSMRAPAAIRHIDAQELTPTAKWTRFPTNEAAPEHQGYRLGDLFAIKRGLATGDNSFFILDEATTRSLKLPRCFLRPVLPGARHLKVDEISGDDAGLPVLDKRLFLIDCDRPPQELAGEYPDLWKYLQTGLESVAPRYLCRSRRLWYAQETRPAAPIVFTYLGRSDRGQRPFRFLLNRSSATATNVYLMLYPRPPLAQRLARDPDILRTLWQALNAIPAQTLLGNGRVYGGGLHKLEPKELGNVPADDLAILAGLTPRRSAPQLDLIA